MNRTYHGLPECGLPLVGSDEPSFSSLIAQIEERPQPFASLPDDDLDTAAVLLNYSGKAIVALAFVWLYTTADGKTRTRRHSNLGSSRQMDVLSGRAEAARDLCSFILPGSMRLITEGGVFGNNLDVLPADFPARGGGYAMGGGGFRRRSDEEIAEVGLSLDVAIFEDGLCAGPDESGLFESISSDLDRQRETAAEIVTALRNGASEGRVFEILRPLASHGIGEPGDSSRLLSMFANMAIHNLVHFLRPDLRAWFESIAEPPRIRLHRE